MAQIASNFRDGQLSSYRDMLRGSTLFARLSEEEATAVLVHARVAEYHTGDQIVAKGDPGESMMAVLKGRVSISVPSLDGRQVVLSVLRSGEVFGEIALLDGKERTADATAISRCEILIIPRRSLWALLEHRMDLCIDLMLVLCNRLRHTNQQVEDLAFLDLQTRMAKVLLRLLSDSNEYQGQLAIRVSQRTLGELAGGSRETVNKHLNAWKEFGVISIERGAIVIRDISTLISYAR